LFTNKIYAKVYLGVVIMKINFKNDFTKKILDRGKKYYNLGCVSEVSIDDNEIKAIVTGTQDYNVSVTIEEESIADSYCTCPYFYDHNECKHIAALLYYLNNKNVDNKKEPKTKKIDLHKIIKEIDNDKLKLFLENTLKKDSHIYELFRREFYNYFPSVSKEEYNKKVWKAIYASGGRDNFIDYRETRDYERNMSEFTNEVDELIKKENYNQAFTLITVLLDSIPNTPIDDSNGSTGVVAYDCIESIHNILDECHSDDVIRNIFLYVVNEIKTDRLSNYGVELNNVIYAFINMNLYLDECEKVLIDKIENLKHEKYSEYEKEKYTNHLLFLYESSKNTEKAQKLIENNLDNDDCFKAFVNDLFKKENLKDVIEFLENYRDNNKKHIKYISETLLEIYQKNNMIEEEKIELYVEFFKYIKYNFNIYKMLKKLYSKEEWTKEYQDIISKINKSKYDSAEILESIYVEEKEYDNLYELTKNSDRVNYHTDVLFPKYQEKIIKYNVNKCLEFLKVAYGRSDYRKVANMLNYIKKIDDKSEYLPPLLMYIKEDYSNKPALLDEISIVKIDSQLKR